MSSLARVRHAVAWLGLLIATGLFGFLLFEYVLLAWLMWLFLPDVSPVLMTEGFARALLSAPGAIIAGGIIVWLLLRGRGKPSDGGDPDASDSKS